MLTNLQSLGQEKFRRIAGLLRQATPPKLIVQLIQDQWGDCSEVPADSLAKELELLRTGLITKSESSQQSTAEDDFGLKSLQSSGHFCLDKMVELGVIRERRIERWREREERSGCIFPEMDVMMNGYENHLKDVQRMKCYLGIDPYVRRMPQDIKKERERQERETQEQQMAIFDAYKTAQEIFEKRFGTTHEVRRDTGSAGTQRSDIE